MADIFLSYARADLERVQPLIHALEQLGWSVWRDAQIRSGRHFDEVIEKALQDVRCVVVVWSKHSVPSRWVRAEAMFGLDHEMLISVSIDEHIELPLLFRQVQTEVLTHWEGTENAAPFAKVKADIEALLGSSPTRPNAWLPLLTSMGQKPQER